MKIYDMHIHAWGEKPVPEQMLAEMEKAGVYGGCVFSDKPPHGSFSKRLEEALAWAKGYEDRIFPVVWIHPYEENIIENIHKAVDAGIAAFKVICTDFYVYEEGAMRVWREIAKLGKPIIFHSGILWDGKVSSAYNRPVNWEALLTIDGLKFSMGHCSWPWIDECIALYGKLLEARGRGMDIEMFFDITPGTPEIYRKELLTKLYTVGYNVGSNIMFGMDSTAHKYSGKWVSNWLEIDRKIFDELGISAQNRQKLYHDNLMRFLGKDKTVVELESPETDDSHVWTPDAPHVKEIIKKWYNKLEFPKCYDHDFYEALETVKISDAVTVETYDKNCKDGKRNLLSFLYMCEETERRYKEKGIPESILLDTLKDIPAWTRDWSNVKGELFLGELPWLSAHLRAKLFKLGRLEFCTNIAHHDIPQFGVKAGDRVIEVHIPSRGKLTPEACEASLEQARAFYAKYFPEYDHKCFTCHSWLLSETLNQYLPESSNILHFGNMFTRISTDESDALLRYIFRWDTNRQNLPYAVPNNEFAEKVKKAALKGAKFYDTLGAIKL